MCSGGAMPTTISIPSPQRISYLQNGRRQLSDIMRDVSICCHINEVVNNVSTAGRIWPCQHVNNLITVTVKGCLRKTEKELKILLTNQVCYIVEPEEDRSSPLSPVFHEFMKAFTICIHRGKNQNIYCLKV